MPIFVFLKNSSDLYRIAENEDFLNKNKNFLENQYDLVSVSQNDFDALRLQKKLILNRTGNTVTLQNISVSFSSVVEMQKELNNYISIIDNYLINNSNKPVANDLILYKNYLKNINPSALITETNKVLNSSIEEYVENQGIKSINLLQLL
jgi:hypothetical protein